MTCLVARKTNCPLRCVVVVVVIVVVLLLLQYQVLFDPSLIGSECPGIHETIFRSIDAADIDLKKNLWSNVVLSGGSTMFNGLRDRLHSELVQLAPAAMQQHIKVRGVPRLFTLTLQRREVVFDGGEIACILFLGAVCAD